jgi:hypothetical protein
VGLPSSSAISRAPSGVPMPMVEFDVPKSIPQDGAVMVAILAAKAAL